MDKFLEQIEIKKNQFNKIKKLIDDSNIELSKLHIDQNMIENSIFDFVDEYNENKKLISKIIKFPKVKKMLKICGIIGVLMMCLLFTIPIVAISFSIDIPAIILLALPLDIASGLVIYKDYKKMVTFRKREIGNFTIKGLEQRNNDIDIEKEKLNIEKLNNEIVISNLKRKIEQYNIELSGLQEDINFIESVRKEYIDKLCTEILNKQYEIEQSKPAFQKVIKPNSKQIN